MDDEKFRNLIQSGKETRNLDFKASCPWDSDKYAKDILAMSNVQFGGNIIIGVAENTSHHTFTQEGVTKSDLETYDEDKMKDDISKYADPHVNFHLHHFKYESKDFLVIAVEPFEDVPVLCSREGKDIHKNRIYYRSTNRRVESAEISNSYDLRDLIERATVNMMKKYNTLGLGIVPSPPEVSLLEKKITKIEQTDTMKKILTKIKQTNTVKKILTKGYWRIIFIPTDDSEKMTTHKDIETVIQNASINFRDLDFPHYPIDISHRSRRLEDNLEVFDNWRGYIELWRMYKNGFFIDYSGIWEDWNKDPQYKIYLNYNTERKDENVLGIDMILYRCTEIFFLLQNLFKLQIYDGDVKVQIELFGLEGRSLFVDGVRKTPLLQVKTSDIPHYAFSKSITKEKALSEAKELAIKVSQEIYYLFNFQYDSHSIIYYQNELLKNSFNRI